MTEQRNNPKLLIVDDEVKLCELLALYFQAKGFSVMAATTVAQATKLLDSTPFDAAILDVNLDGESGFDVLDYIKRTSPAMPVCMFTGLDVDEQLVKKTLRGRAEGITHKTQSLERISEAVRSRLARPM